MPLPGIGIGDAMERAVTAAVKIAHKSFNSASFEIEIEPYIAPETGIHSGRSTFGAPFTVRAMTVSSENFMLPNAGPVSTEYTHIQILEPCMVRPQDRVTLPNGRKPQVQSVTGTLNPKTGLYYCPKVQF